MILSIQQLSFERNYQNLLHNINITLHAGEILHVKGENGSGKSTLLRILAGFIQPQEGNIFWNNQCITKHTSDYQQQLHYVGHQNAVKLHLTVHENLQLICALHNQKQNKIETILRELKISHLANKKTLYISAGQQRRVALSRLLLYPTALWLLDEPTTALDKEGQQLFNELLKQHIKQGGMAILTAHHEIPYASKSISLSSTKNILEENYA
jgi:heme exporter protein A